MFFSLFAVTRWDVTCETFTIGQKGQLSFEEADTPAVKLKTNYRKAGITDIPSSSVQTQEFMGHFFFCYPVLLFLMLRNLKVARGHPTNLFRVDLPSD